MTQGEHMEQWIAKRKKERDTKVKGHKLEAQITNGVKYEEAEYLKELRTIESGLEEVFGPFGELEKELINVMVSLKFRSLLYCYLGEMKLRKELCYESDYYEERLAETTRERDRLKATLYN